MSGEKFSYVTPDPVEWSQSRELRTEHASTYKTVSAAILKEIGVSESTLKEFSKIRRQIGKYPYFELKDGKVQFEGKMKDRDGHFQTLTISPEATQDVEDCYVKAFMTWKAESDSRRETAKARKAERDEAIKIKQAAEMAKDRGLKIGGACLGVACLISAGLLITTTIKNTKDIRDAVADYMGDVTWEDTDNNTDEYSYGYGYNYETGHYSYNNHLVSKSGTKSTYKSLIKKALDRAKTRGTSFKQELLGLSDKYDFDVISDKDGILTIRLHAENGTKRNFQIDTQKYMVQNTEDGNRIVYSYEENRKRRRTNNLLREEDLDFSSLVNSVLDKHSDENTDWSKVKADDLKDDFTTMAKAAKVKDLPEDPTEAIQSVLDGKVLGEEGGESSETAEANIAKKLGESRDPIREATDYTIEDLAKLKRDVMAGVEYRWKTHEEAVADIKKFMCCSQDYAQSIFDTWWQQCQDGEYDVLHPYRD